MEDKDNEFYFSCFFRLLRDNLDISQSEIQRIIEETINTFQNTRNKWANESQRGK